MLIRFEGAKLFAAWRPQINLFIKADGLRARLQELDEYVFIRGVETGGDQHLPSDRQRVSKHDLAGIDRDGELAAVVAQNLLRFPRRPRQHRQTDWP